MARFEQGVPWHSGNYRVRIHSETRTWHDKNIQSKHQFLIGKQGRIDLKHFHYSKAFIKYLMDDIYKSIEEYNPNEWRKILTVFDDIILDILSNKKINPLVTELFFRGRKLNVSLVFIAQSCSAVPKILE